jgi:hypothetical protein
MSPRDRFTRALPWAASLATLLLLAVPAWPQSTGAPEAPTAPRAPEPPARPAVESDLAERVRARFEVDVLRDGVLLRPLAGGGPVRSIELSDDGEVLVNGKEFNEEELEGFLGADGRLALELARLDADERRDRLGYRDPDETEEDEAAGPGDVDVDVDIPGVPGTPRIRVRASKEDRVSVGRSIEIKAGETSRDVVCVACSVDVSGHVTGDAVAVGGSVRVRPGAVVEGSGVVVGGSLELEPGAVIEGDGVAVGGSVDAAEGAQILGQRSSVGIGGRWFGPFGDGWGMPFGVFSSVRGFVWSLFRTGFLALLVGLCLLAARPAVAAAGRRMTGEPWKALFAGLLTQLLFLPVLVLVTVILAVSIVGIPLLVLVPVALVALVIGALVGFTAVAFSVGESIEARLGRKVSGVFLTALLGVVAIQGLTLVGRLIGMPGGVLGFFGIALIALGFAIKYVAWTIGLGSMTLVAFGRDWRRARAEPALAEPASALEPRPTEPPPPPPTSPRQEDAV